MKAIVRCLAFIAAVCTASAWAAPDPAPSRPADPVIEKATAAIDGKDWKQAQDVLREGLARNPSNAEYHNLFAYSIRMGANPQMELVFKHYNEALRLDKDHRGAHEYLGEAYLMTGNLEKAKEHLKILDSLCFFACKEFTTLKKAIADYEAKQPK